MKKTILKLILLLIISSTITSCNSNDDDNGFTPTLPPITQTGANTFGCYVDGELLVPRDGTGTYLGADKGMTFWALTDNITNEIIYNEIRVRDFKSAEKGILKIHFNELFQNEEGIFNINESNCEDGLAAIENINITCRWLNKWYCSSENSGIIEITKYNYNNKIVSGTFSCTAINRDNPNESIEITEGRFDLKWDTLPYTNFP